MVRDLETRRPRVIVLFQGGYVPEPNASNREGSPVLDNYIKSRYETYDSSRDYLMLLRRQATGRR